MLSESSCPGQSRSPDLRLLARPVRCRGAAIPPAVVSAAVLGLLGAAGFWLLRPPAALPEPVLQTSGVPAAPAGGPAPEFPKTWEPPPLPAPVPGFPVPAPAAPAPPLVVARPAEMDPFAGLLVLDDMGGSKKENAARFASTWQTAADTFRWLDYQELLARSLRAAAARRTGAAAIASGKYSGPALIRHAFLAAVPAETLTSLLGNSSSVEFTRWLLDQPAAMQAFLPALTPQDDVEKALGIWAAIAAEHPAALTEYRELAIACALVFDRTIPVKDDRYGGEVDALARYAHFEKNDRAGRLAAKISRLTAAELVWAVGVPISQAELDWALEKADFRQKFWGQAYQTIKYDMEKAVSGKDSYDEYTFAEIRKKGGICVDQSYFTAWTACAHGIPAAIITGDGARGPHAWITWMADGGDWKFSGRFDGYPAGRTECPQTGETISEEEFVRLGDRKAATPERRLSASQALWLARVFAPEPERAEVFLTEAVSLAPAWPNPSAALLAHWCQHRAAAPVAEWTALLKTLRKDFRTCAPLMLSAKEAEQKFVFTRQENTLTMKDLRRESRRVEDPSGSRTGVAADLDRLTAGLRQQADLLVAQANPDALRLLYRRALGEHGANAAAFKALAQDFFAYRKTDPALALDTCRELESACRRSVGRGAGDWFDVTSQNSAWEVVAACYRTAGDAPKADLILRDCASREKAARQKSL